MRLRRYGFAIGFGRDVRGDEEPVDAVEEDRNGDDDDLERDGERHLLELARHLVVRVAPRRRRVVLVEVEREEPADRNDARRASGAAGARSASIGPVIPSGS